MKKVEKDKLLTALYCRLSVDDFKDISEEKRKKELESNSITNQKQILEEYCHKNGILNYRFFVDDGITGTTFDRPGFNEMDRMIDSERSERLS